MRRHAVILQKIENARERHKEEYNAALSACREYGSELASDVWNKTKEIESEIKHLEALIAMPEVYMNHEVLVVRLEDIKVDTSHIEEDIAELEEKKQQLLEKKRAKASLSRSIKELMAIPFET
jgi:hypothetical protein